MSDLLNQASLVMVPSGYKEDTVFSVVPSDGSGDLSFTRASNGTRVNSAGLVEVCPWNLVQYSEDFTNGAWVQENNIVTSNSVIAPNGTTTGETISNSATTALFRTYQGPFVNYAQPQTLTFSTYFKYKDHRYISFGITDDIDYRSQVVVDLQNMVITQNYKSNSGDVLTSTIESVGNGWYRVTGTLTYNTAFAGGNLYFLYKFQNSGTFYGLSTSQTGTGFYIWGAQMNTGALKPYFPTTDRLNVPRLTYQNGGGGCPSLLLEKQSTNLVLWSEDLSNADWTKGSVTITANDAISPDGTQNADRVVETSAGGQHLFYENITVTNGATYTLTAFYKAQQRTAATLQLADGASRFTALFDLSAGTILTTRSLGIPSGTSSSITNMGNGWYRCSITMTQAVGTIMIPHGALSNSNTPTWDIYDFPIYTGNTANGLLAWGFQVEASSYPTSYIPTTSSSATRVADACSKTGISSLIGQTEGVVFVDINRNYITSSYDRYFAVDDADASIYRTGIFILPEPTIDGRVYVELRNNNTGVFGYTYNSTTIPRLKIAVAYKNNDMAIYINGTQMATSSASLTFAHTLSGVLSSGNGQSINEAILFPTRLTNAELASLTTI